MTYTTDEALNTPVDEALNTPTGHTGTHTSTHTDSASHAGVRRTLSDLQAKDKWEKNNTIRVPIYLYEDKEGDPDFYLGSILMVYDPEGYTKKVTALNEQWKLRHRKMAEVPMSVLLEHGEEATIGTWVRGLVDWLEEDENHNQTPMADTTENLRLLMDITQVSDKVARLMGERSNWEAAYRASLGG